MLGEREVDRRRYERVQALFLEVCDLDEEERTAHLERRAGGDRALEAEVRDLLAREASHGAGLTRELSAEAREAMEAVSAPAIERIGPHRVLGVLGRGGMGIVYRARQEHPRRDVAIKLLPAGLLTPGTERLFRREVDALARLEHPGIARIHEAGVDDLGFGEQPYYVMELVEGRSLTDWAKGRPLEAKLATYLALCAAVQHANDKGVVHRDLKPDNVLVTASGEPKMLDFGVARVIDEEQGNTLFTTVATEVMGTLPYMSPEQIAGESKRIDARTDVYALGVILYELLSGSLPHELTGLGLPEAARVIREEEARRLPTARLGLDSDLATIVATALEKDVERRYRSAGALAADLRRFLRNEPILARRPSTLYQLKKLARRNRKLFLMTAAAFVALLGGTITSTVLALRASAARDDAEEQAARARQLAGFAAEIFVPRKDDGEEAYGIEGLLDNAVLRIEREFTDQPDLAGDLYYAIAVFYRSLGEPQKAKRVIEEAIEMRRATRDDSPEELVASLRLLGGLVEDRRDSARKVPIWEEIHATLERAFGPRDARTLEARLTYVSILGKAGELERAARLAGEVRPNPEDRTLGRQLLVLGESLYRNGEFDEAEDPLVEVLEVAASDRSRVAWTDRFWANFQLCALYTDTGRFAEASQRAEVLLLCLEDLDAGTQLSAHAYARYMVAYARLCAGDAGGSEELARQAIDDFRADGSRAPFAHRELGRALAAQGRLLEAETAFREFLRMQRENTGDGEWYVAQAEALLADVRRERGDLDEALELARSSVERNRRVLRPGHPRIADGLEPLARVLLSLGQLDEAEDACGEAIEIRSACMEEAAVPVARLRLLQASILDARGDARSARLLAERAVGELEASFTPEHPELARARGTLASLGEGAAVSGVER